MTPCGADEVTQRVTARTNDTAEPLEIVLFL
jgi:hypothetical protein